VSDKLQINAQIIGDSVHVKLVGQIDEDADFSKIKELLAKVYEFNFDEIFLINSCGIREWINFIEELGSSVEIEYIKCPQIIIELINMVHGFIRKGATVKSFYVPYFCESKNEERKILVQSSEIVNRKAPVKVDELTGEELEFDAIEEQYFNFLPK